MVTDEDKADQGGEWPTPLRCEQCQREVPPDEALHPEGQDYTLAFCSPACHALWREEQAEPLISRHRQRSGRED
ncbi:hypothetical protein CKO40_11945 [Halochromatium glycolicum]|jgi:hypothetical protein|uniref:TRASH domain-containing protein n=1 Tax=Halochromatium glycolicum TaxID=85075 RepID=A0AAJ0U5N0_9GAMM|nr:hypothetical protein [Halochromatium glycolicum]